MAAIDGDHAYTQLEATDTRPVCDTIPQFNIARKMVVDRRIRAAVTVQRPNSKLASCWAKFRWGKWVIKPNPGRNCPHWIVCWDVYIAILVLVTSFYVPMQASLGLKSPIFDYLCDCAFVADMVLQFFVAQPATGGGEKSSHGLWVVDPLELGSNYLKGPFWPDLVSIMPIFISSIPINNPESASGKDFAAFLRGLSICRLVRLARLERIIKRWQASSGIPFFYIELTKFFVVICFSTHWGACAWAMLVRKETIDMFSMFMPLENTWLSALVSSKGDPCINGAENAPMCVYALSVYWSAMTLTTVGYGDITPQNLLEYIICSGIMIISGIVWAYVVGSIVSMVANSEPLEVEFKQRMDELNVMMTKHGIDLQLQVRLRRYMHEAKHFHRLQGHRTLLSKFISPGLQREIAQASAKAPLLEAVFWIGDLENEAYHEFVKCLDPMFYGPLEPIHAVETMIVVHTGVVAARGQILTRGDVWGHETVLLESYALAEDRSPMTLSYVDVLRLSRQDIALVMTLHPDAAVRIRKAQVRCAAFRGFLWAASLEREGLDWTSFTNCLGSKRDIKLRDHVHHPEVHVLKSIQRAPTTWHKNEAGAKLSTLSTRKGKGFLGTLENSVVEDPHVHLKRSLREEMRQEFQDQLVQLEARLPSKADLTDMVASLSKPQKSLHAKSSIQAALGPRVENRSHSR